MDTPLRWGILATGGIARLQTADLQTAGLTVSAVGSRSQESASAFAREFGIPQAYGSYRELCESPDVDIIYVATPHPMHMENALLALEAGKHVLVEKAFTINAGQARAVAEASARRGLFVMEAMWTRFLPMMERVRAIIRAGGIGQPRVLLADHNQWLPIEKARRVQDPELGGGALLDLGIYPLSFAWDLFGRPTEMQVSGTLTSRGVDEMIGVLLIYPDGAQAVLHTGSLTPGPNTASIVGDAGRIDIDPVWYNQTSFTHYDRAGERVERYTETITGRGMQYQAMEVERCIREALPESPRMPMSHTLALMEQMDEIRRRVGVSYPDE